MKVFISYATEDQESAERLYEHLSKLGWVEPWMDTRELLPGVEWKESILTALDESEAVIALLSTHSVGKEGFGQREVRLALDRALEQPGGGIFLIPVRLDECQPRFRQLRGIQRVDLFPDWDHGFERVVQALRSKAGGNRSKPVQVPISPTTPDLPRQVQEILDRVEAGRQMIFDRVEIDRVVERPWLDARVDAAIADRKGGYVHLEAQAGAGKTAYLARFVRERDCPSFFFDASQGITGAAALHQALWAQLVERGWVSSGPIPEGLGTDSRVLRRLLDEAASKAAEPLLLVVDALDEAEASSGSPALLPVLPEGVTVLTSARTETRQPPNALFIPVDVESDESEKDVRRFIESRTKEDDVLEILAKSDWGRRRLVREVAERTGGMFAHAHFVLADLARGQLSLNALESLAPGLDRYFQQTWTRWQEADQAAFREVLRPTLAVVAAARAPVLPEWVAAWAGLDPVDAEEALDNQLRPWVTGSRNALGITRYRLYHQSVRDFLRGKAEVLLRQMEELIAESCLHWMRDGKVVDSRNLRSYAVENGVWHLLNVGRPEETTELLSDLAFLDEHREAAGNQQILAELLALRTAKPCELVESLLHAWSDEAFTIEDRQTFLSQFSYVLSSNPLLEAELRTSFERLAAHTEGAWLLCRKPVAPRSTFSLTLRGHEAGVFQCVFGSDDRTLISASEDGTLRVWDLATPGREPQVLRGHESGVRHCVLSSDDRTLVSASLDGTLRVWDLAAPDSEPQVLRGHTLGLSHCVLGSDDRTLVSASWDGTLRVWDLTAPVGEVEVLCAHQVRNCVLTSDNQTLVSASDDGTLRVWDLSAPESEPHVLRGHERGVVHCVLGSDDRTLVSASWDGTLRVWDLAAPDREPNVLRGHEGWVFHCVLGSDDRTLVSASLDGTLRVWDLAAPDREPHVLRGHENGVRHCVLGSDDRTLVSASLDGTLRVWDLAAPDSEPQVLRGHEDWVFHCVLGSDDRTLVSASLDGTVRMWELVTPAGEPKVLHDHKLKVSHCVLGSDDRTLVSASEDGTLRLWDLGAPESEPEVLRGHEDKVHHCVLGSDDRTLVSASGDGTLQVWDLAARASEPEVLRGHEGKVHHCVLGSDDRTLVSASDDRTLRVWDLATPESEPEVLRGHRHAVFHCVLGSDDRTLVSASDDGTLQVWDLAAPDGERQILQGHESHVRHCVLASDNLTLVSASADGTLRVWDLAAPGGEPEVLRGHEGRVYHCVLGSDDRTLVSASDDRTLRVWNLAALESELKVLRGHEGSLEHCVLASDNQTLVSASDDGTLRVWNVASGECLTKFRAVGAVTWVGWAKDDRWVLAGDASGRVWFFELVGIGSTAEAQTGVA